MLTLLTAPATASVSLTDAKAWLRVDTTADDALIPALVRECELNWEAWTGLPMLVATYSDHTRRGFYGEWSPARQPVVSVVSVSLVDAETGAAAAMDGADWRLVPTPGGHVVEFDAGSIAGDEYALVTWTAGYSAVQPLHKAWLLRTLANRYRFRGDDPEGRGAATDTAADWLRQSMARSVIA